MGAAGTGTLTGGDAAPQGSLDGYDPTTALVAHVADCPPVAIGYAAFQHPLEPVSICVGEPTPLVPVGQDTHWSALVAVPPVKYVSAGHILHW